MTHRQLVTRVRDRMEEAGITPAELYQRLRGKVVKQTVYNFVKHGRVIKSDTLLLVLKELGLTVRPGRS